MPKVFLSFAAEDLDFVIRLFTRLKSLRVDVWDYSKKSEGIDLGKEVNPALGVHISESDYFLPVVSCDSARLSKTAVQFEVEYAVRMNKVCIPIVIATRPPEEWAGAFGLIKNIRYTIMDHKDEVQFEEQLAELCSYLGVQYKPDEEDHARLPFFQRFWKESNLPVEVHRQRDRRYVYERLVSYINEFNVTYFFGKWQKCLQTIIDFLQYCNLERFPVSFYYPLIVKGACELQLHLLEDAKKTFELAAQSPDRDESSYGGLGHVCLRQGRLEEARNQYELALSVCPPERQSTVIYNILLTAVEILRAPKEQVSKALEQCARDIVGKSGYIRRLESMPDISRREKLAIDYLVGMAFMCVGNDGEAYGRLHGIYAHSIFSLPAMPWADELDAPAVSTQLHRVFKGQGFLLPVETSIHKGRPQHDGASDNRLWIIRAGDAIYRIQQTGKDKDIRVYYRELSLIIYFSGLMEKLGGEEDAMNILEKEALALDERILFHYYAGLLVRVGKVGKAAEVYATHLCGEPYDKQYLVEYALVLKHFQRDDEMRDTCNKVIAIKRPQIDKDIYYHGYAHFLLGKKETAQDYYEDSGPYAEPYTDDV